MALKGFGCGLDGEPGESRITRLNLDWHYGWSAGVQSVAKDYVPMTWSGRDLAAKLALIKSELPLTKATHILGFNEPDFEKQSNMSVDEALAAWPKLEATGLKLVSPATIKPNADWMIEFMRRAIAQGRRIDAVAVHVYQSPDADNLLRKLTEAYERWGKPIWLTEYGVADWDATTRSQYGRTEVNQYMADTVEGMNALPFVHRYAWKTREATDPVMGTGALFDSRDWRTSTGMLYSSL